MSWSKLATPTLNKHSIFMFAPQSAEGDAGYYWLYVHPFSGTLDSTFRATWRPLSSLDGVEYLHHFYTAGAWFEGSVPLVLSPEGVPLPTYQLDYGT